LKHLIKKIIKESEPDWWDDIVNDFEENSSPGIIWYKSTHAKKGTNVDLKTIYALIASNSFKDLVVEGTDIYLKIDSFCELSECFFYNRRGNDGVLSEFIVDKIYCEEDWFELFDDTYQNWYEDIWENMVMQNKKEVYDSILKHIQKYYVIPNDYNPTQLDIFGNLPEKKKIHMLPNLGFEGDRIIALNTDYFDWLKDHPRELGRLINKEKVFYDIKSDISSAYHSAYNVAATDNIHDAIKNGITKKLGPFERRDGFYFINITDLFRDEVFNYFNDCFEWCKSSAEDCTKCHDFDYLNFLSFYINTIRERDDRWVIHFDAYPDDSSVQIYFSEDIMDRF